jgi:virulence-associated protein VapD
MFSSGVENFDVYKDIKEELPSVSFKLIKKQGISIYSRHAKIKRKFKTFRLQNDRRRGT